jgi:hypothetical protein
VSLRTLIVDPSEDFRTILRLLLLREWPGTQVTEWDPAVKGRPPLDRLPGAIDVVLFGYDVDSPGNKSWTDAGLATCNAPVILLTERDPREGATPPADCPPSSVLLGKRDLSQATLAAAVGRAVPSDSLPPRAASTNPQGAADTITAPPPAEPPEISGLRIIRRVASGGMSTIYLAEHGAKGECALKVLDPTLLNDEGFLRRFLDEYALLARVKTNYVPVIYDQGITDEHVYIAMEYFPGGDLKSRLSKGMPPADALVMLREIAQALVVIHGAGIVHRDLKPDNIMYRADESLALIDFGIARGSAQETTINPAGQVLGTPYYISPEQCLDRPVDGRADVYSLGVIFYEALAGERPFKATSLGGLLHQHVHVPPLALPQHLARFQSLIDLMLAKQPEDRLTAAELIAVLKLDFTQG